MGFSTNQDRKSVEIFCRSAIKHHDKRNCDVVIFTNKYEDYFLGLEKVGVRFVYTPSKYSSKTSTLSKVMNRVILHSLRIADKVNFKKYAKDIFDSYPNMIEAWHHPHFARWFAYKNFLDLNRNYQEVFISDVKDVIFQGNVFTNTGIEYLNLFKQNVTYGDDDWDTRWYRDAWGQQELAKIVGKPAICIGTILGASSSVSGVVDTLVEFYKKFPFKGIEQAGFNYLIYHDLIETKYSMVENIDNQVATLTSAAYQFVEYDGQNIVRKHDKSIIPAVHMYDRFPDMMRVTDLYQDHFGH